MDPKDDQLAGSQKDNTPRLPIPEDNPAAELLRQKINQIYSHEPSASKELKEVQNLSGHKKLSKHQMFMLELSKSAKTPEEIQIEWHDYYGRLSEQEKHEVWQEFHANQHSAKHPTPSTYHTPHHQAPAHSTNSLELSRKTSKKTPAEIKRQINSNVMASKKLGPKQHLQSVFFGIGVGAIVLLVLLFGFFNERFIAPFITPAKAVSSTPIISDSTTAVGKDPKIIIPKINVEIPVVYGVDTVEEKKVQSALESGVVHYANTAEPGQIGNSVIVGHSSNNIFNSGKYKFAFVLLKKLDKGDTFMMEKDGVRYTYKVTDKKVVSPTDLSVLEANGSTSSVTLITCDPPGTSINRLVVVGEQISPDPTANKPAPSNQATTKPQTIAGNSPTLWSRLVDSLF